MFYIANPFTNWKHDIEINFPPTLGKNRLKKLPPRFFMEHLLQGLHGVDAPAVPTSRDGEQSITEIPRSAQSDWV